MVRDSFPLLLFQHVRRCFLSAGTQRSAQFAGPLDRPGGGARATPRTTTTAGHLMFRGLLSQGNGHADCAPCRTTSLPVVRPPRPPADDAEEGEQGAACALPTAPALYAWLVSCPTNDSCTRLRSLPTRPLFHSNPFGNVFVSHTKRPLLSPDRPPRLSGSVASLPAVLSHQTPPAPTAQTTPGRPRSSRTEDARSLHFPLIATNSCPDQWFSEAQAALPHTLPHAWSFGAAAYRPPASPSTRPKHSPTAAPSPPSKREQFGRPCNIEYEEKWR